MPLRRSSRHHLDDPLTPALENCIQVFSRAQPGRGWRACCSGIEYEGTSHFLATALSAKIGFGKVNLQPLEGEAL
jgi:hypothetical protein